LYAKKIENLKGGSHLLQSTESFDPTTGLSKALVDLNLKGVEIDKLKKTIATKMKKSKTKTNYCRISKVEDKDANIHRSNEG
jgi:hypothetical protein